MAILTDESMSSAQSVYHGNSVPRSNGDKNMLPEDFAPGPHSVICGRGKACANAAGNRRLKTIVDSHLKPYSEAKTKLEKSEIVSTIVNVVKQATSVGAFVKLEGGRYWEVEDSVSREKVGCMLRDCLHSQYRSSTKSKLARRRQHRVNEANQTGLYGGSSHHRQFFHGSSGSSLNFSNHGSSYSNSCGLDYSQHSTNSYDLSFSNHNISNHNISNHNISSRHNSELSYSNHSSTSRGLDFHGGVVGGSSSCHSSRTPTGGYLDFNSSDSSGLDFGSSFANGLDFSNHESPRHSGPCHTSGPAHSNSNSILYPEEEMSCSSSSSAHSAFMSAPTSMGNNNMQLPNNNNPLLGMTHQQLHLQQQQQQQSLPTKNLLQSYMPNGVNHHSNRMNYLRDYLPMTAHLDIMGGSSSTMTNPASNNYGSPLCNVAQQSVAEACLVMSSAPTVGANNNNISYNGSVSSVSAMNNDNLLCHEMAHACNVAQCIAHSGPNRTTAASVARSSRIGFATSRMTIEEELPEDISNIFDECM
jgi:hypothetical protein